MHSNRVLRTTILSVIIVLSSMLPSSIFNPTVSAESSGGNTTLYFHDFLESDGIIDENFPTKTNDSQWPPGLFDSENMLLWATYLLTSLLLENESEFELDAFSSLLLDPYTVWGMYETDSNESLNINGDVVFDVYIKSPMVSKIKKNDKLQVSIFWLDFENLFDINFEDFDSELDFFEEINTNYSIKPSALSLNSINHYSITIENFNLTLFPGTMLMFAIKIIPGNKPLANLLTFDGPLASIRENILPEFKKDVFNWLLNKGNSSKNDLIKSISEAIILIKDILVSQNITKDDYKDIINGIRSSSIVYDSVDHPTSVIVPFVTSEDAGNNYVYYFDDENKMNEELQSNNTVLKIELFDGPIQWESPPLERNKILNEATARLFINHRGIYRFWILLLGKITINAKLLVNSTEIASVEQKLGRTFIFNLFSKPDTPLPFIFEFEPNEIEYGQTLTLELSASKGPKIAPLGFRRSAKLFFGTTDYPSSLSVKFNETKHITMDVTSEPANELIVPGGSVEYHLNISSKFDDKLTVNVKTDNDEDWDVTILDQEIDIKSGKIVDTSVIVKSIKDKKSAYGESLDFTITVTGKTGIAKKKTSVDISENAIEYDVNIVDYTKGKSIKPGSSGSLYFIVENKNTGASDDVDSYTIDVSSKNGWEIKHTNTIDNLGIGKKIGLKNEILVSITVPKNTTKKSDTIFFTVTSINNPDAFAVINVTVEVIDSSIFESIYDIFESASESIGLDDIFGSYGPHALAAIIVLVILIIIILLFFIFTRKIMNILCAERIKEIDPDGKAIFKIEIENPSRKKRDYEINIVDNPSGSNWIKSLDTKKINIESRKSKTVILTVIPTDEAHPNDWIETKVHVKVAGRRIIKEISTMSLIKDGKTLLKISDVFNWPKEIIPGNRITTSFKLSNNGNITARNVVVKLFINGKEKNKTEVTIPRSGYADIRIPWIAMKGRNKLLIKAIEH